MRRCSTREWGGLAFGVLAVALSGGVAAGADLDVYPLHSQASAAILRGRFIFVEVYSGRVDAYLAPGVESPAVREDRVRLEWGLLAPAVQAMALRRLFPSDTVTTKEWVHRVVYPGSDSAGETLSQLALWFTGNASAAPELARLNRLHDGPLKAGTEVRIPRSMLLGPLAESLPKRDPIAQTFEMPRRPAPVSAADPRRPSGPLSYGRDASGAFALYRLQPGEVLHSDVVVRFTGRVDVEEVIEAAGHIQRRSAILDSRDLDAGTPVKIPLELLEPEYLPPEDPRHQRFVQDQLETRGYRSRTPAKSLEGVVVVLDPGHGGDDPGTLGACGICEDEYVYDVAVRVGAIIRSETQGRVLYTMRDRKHAERPRDEVKLAMDGTEELLTSPRYDATDSKLSAHLRWYLANSLYRRLLRQGHDRSKVVFTSFHADSRHPSAPGMMIYVAGASESKGSMEKTSKSYRRFEEVREQPKVSYTREERVRSEALSRDLAEVVVASMNRSGVGVHTDVPIRASVIRRGRKWVPAVLRYNAIPTKLLVEIANLASRRACELMKDPLYRDKVARAYVQALVDYFGAPDVPPAAARRS